MQNNKGEKKLATVWTNLGSLTVIKRSEAVLYLFFQALRSLVISPITSVSCVLTVTAAMIVLGGVLLLMDNVGDVMQSSKEDLSCRLYFKEGVAEGERQQIAQELKERKGVVAVKEIDKKAALNEFKESLEKYVDLFENLEEENPLPISLLVTLDQDNEEVVAEIFEHYTDNKAIEYVQYDKEFVTRFSQILRFFKKSGIFSIVALLLITAVIIANTVRLTLVNRSDEIVIMRLVGADTLFVKAPCIIEGGLYGLLGGSASLVVLYFSWNFLIRIMGEVPLWQLFFSNVHFLSFYQMVVLVFVAVLVGVFSSATAVWRLSER